MSDPMLTRSVSDMTGDRPLLGIALMLGFCLMAPMGDALGKLLAVTVPLNIILLARFGVQAAVLLPLALVLGKPLTMSRRTAKLLAIRTVLHIIGIGTMILSLRYLPLADAVAIAFVMPFIMLLLGKYVLGEEVGWRRLIACTIGFCGTLLVIQPSFAAVGAPALLPLIVALVFALFMLTTRQIAREIDPISLQVVSGMLACALLGTAYLLPAASYVPDLAILRPTNPELILLGLAGIIGTIAHLFMTWSLRFAPSATLAPMQYLEIPVATVIGYLLFSDWPNPMAMTGIAITIASGLYVIAREQRIARKTVQQIAL